MKLTTGIRREMGALVLDALPPVPQTVADMVSALGGSREAARALGLKMDTQAHIQHSQRDIQRYVSFERDGKTPNNRRISPENRRKLQEAAATVQRNKRYREVQEAGIAVKIRDVEVIDPSGVPDGTRDIDIILSGDALARFLNAYNASIFGVFDLEETAEIFDEEVMEEYGFPGAHIDAGPDALPTNGFSLTLAR